MRISDWSSDVCSSDLKDGAEGCRARHRGESRWKIVAGAEELIVVDAIGGRDARDGIALPDIILDRCIEEAVSHRPSRANKLQEPVEAVAAGAELELGLGIEGIFCNRPRDRALHPVVDDRDQPAPVLATPHGLIRVADPVPLWRAT